MRALLKMIVAAAAVSFSAAHLQAAPVGASAPPNSTAVQLAQDRYYPEHYRAACPSGMHFACWYQPYGTRFCGCWYGGDRPACPVGYHYDCRLGPNGYRDCACY